MTKMRCKMLVISRGPPGALAQQALGHLHQGQVATVIMVSTPGRAGRAQDHEARDDEQAEEQQAQGDLGKSTFSYSWHSLTRG